MAHLITTTNNYPTEFQFQNAYRYVPIAETAWLFKRETREEEGGPVSSREFYFVAASEKAEAEAIVNEEIDRYYGGDWFHTVKEVVID